MSDPRFARLKSDPRFRRPKKKQQKVVVDERFKGLFAQEKGKRSVDKYGRTVTDRQAGDDLRRYYRLGVDDAQDAEGADENVPKRPDFARGEVLLESSDEEDVDDDKKEDEDEDGVVTLGADSSHPIPVRNDAEFEIDLDEENYADLDAQAAKYAEEHEASGDEAEGTSGQTERTRRLAIVNLDWDHVRAHHLYKICASLVSPSAPSVKAASKKKDVRAGKGVSQVGVVRGKVLAVRVYPSDFGKERMAKEEREGPPPEIFKRRDLDADEINEKNIYEVGGEDEYDEDALRKYQLERLRYYYAIVECDTVEAASHIYDELEGTELERSANVFNMSFVPDDMTFENEIRDEATDEGSTNYKAVEFVTDALRHSKVKLTWDEDDPERSKVTRRALTKQEIEDNDFRAYIATSSSEDEDEDDGGKQKKKASRDKLRGLLLGGNKEEMPEGWGDDDGADVDMEVTFAPGLSAGKSKEDETTLEQYQRKMREKRKKRKEAMKEKKDEGGDEEHRDEPEDEFFETGPGNSGADDEVPIRGPKKGNKDAKKKGGKTQETKTSSSSTSRPEVSAEELALLVDSDKSGAEPKHFNLKAVMKAEKKKKNKHKKRGRKGDKDGEDNEAQEDFTIDVQDERFKALHENHQFAIDPTNPQFKKTKGMQALLEERQKRQRDKRGDEFTERVVNHGKTGPSPQEVKDNSLQGLVESVKRKSSEKAVAGQGKRRKLQ